jgi:hypothetical protein
MEIGYKYLRKDPNHTSNLRIKDIARNKANPNRFSEQVT